MAAEPNKTWDKWHQEYSQACKAKGYEQWRTRARKIIKRYRDERVDAQTDVNSDTINGARFNILWSNIQTLKPALFAKSPKPVVERRYLDKDEVGRTASVILERSLLYELDDGCYQSAVSKAVLDRLLSGRGVVWVRYEPRFTPLPGKAQETKDAANSLGAGNVPDGNSGVGARPDRSGNTSDEPLTEGEAEPQEQVASESVPVDYVDWDDFQTSPARTWEEVWWIDKKVYMTREELRKRFKKKNADGKLIADIIPLDWTPGKEQKTATAGQPLNDGNDGQKRAKVHETWDKSKRKVIWWADGYSDDVLDEVDDPLKLDGFWPTPKPLFASLTNDTLVPIPDYIEYQDQANELDDLTQRINSLTKAIKIAGVYDASVTELQRILEEGYENKLAPCDNMAEFSQKAGANGMGHIWLMPIKELAEVLLTLYGAREQVKASLYEITGLSDIVRGQAAQGAGDTTATEQRIKGQFASMRLNDMQAEVARFCRDTLRIMGEIIAEHFDPMTLFLVSGFEQYAKEQWPAESFQPPQMGQNGGPPMTGGAPPPGMGVAGGAIPPDATAAPFNPEMAAQAKAADMFQKAVALLRNDKLRGFRIDIETDSIIEADQQQMQQSRTELMGAISQFLPQAIEAGKVDPALRPLLARLLMFFLRGFKASRDIESAFEQFVDDMQKQAANPPPTPPSPEELKAQAEMAKQEGENKRMQLQAQIDQQNAEREAFMADQENQRKIAMMNAEMEMKERDMKLEEIRQGFKIREMEAKAALEQRTADIAATSLEHKTGLDMQATERKHELGLEVAEAKAAAAKKPNGGANA